MKKNQITTTDVNKFKIWYENKFQVRMPLYIQSEEKRKLILEFNEQQSWLQLNKAKIN